VINISDFSKMPLVKKHSVNALKNNIKNNKKKPVELGINKKKLWEDVWKCGNGYFSRYFLFENILK